MSNVGRYHLISHQTYTRIDMLIQIKSNLWNTVEADRSIQNERSLNPSDSTILTKGEVSFIYLSTKNVLIQTSYFADMIKEGTRSYMKKYCTQNQILTLIKTLEIVQSLCWSWITQFKDKLLFISSQGQVSQVLQSCLYFQGFWGSKLLNGCLVVCPSSLCLRAIQ